MPVFFVGVRVCSHCSYSMVMSLCFIVKLCSGQKCGMSSLSLQTPTGHHGWVSLSPAGLNQDLPQDCADL